VRRLRAGAAFLRGLFFIFYCAVLAGAVIKVKSGRIPGAGHETARPAPEPAGSEIPVLPEPDILPESAEPDSGFSELEDAALVEKIHERTSFYEN
jgi:hypothetical protein